MPQCDLRYPTRQVDIDRILAFLIDPVHSICIYNNRDWNVTHLDISQPLFSYFLSSWVTLSLVSLAWLKSPSHFLLAVSLICLLPVGCPGMDTLTSYRVLRSPNY